MFRSACAQRALGSSPLPNPSRAPAAGSATARGEEAERAAAPAQRSGSGDPTSALAMGRRILNDALRTMVNADRRGNATALLQPISGVMVSFLNIMKHRGSIPPLTR